MAKKTKDSNLSLDERLEQALIPNWDEPYKLPKNWCWVSLGSLGTLGMGQTILSKDLKDEGIPVYSATEEDKIFGYIAESENKIKLCAGDIVIPARGTIGHVKYISCDEASCTQTTMFFKPLDKTIGKCVYYYMLGNKQRLFAYHGNAIPQITITNIIKKEIPIPPLDEQLRIVERIESLFAKLDEAKEKAQEVVDGFETHKAAILHKAFSGELTANWRKENGVNTIGYAKRRFDEVAIIKSNLVDPAEYQDYPHIAPDNIEKKTGVLLEYHTIAEDGVKSGKHRFYPRQILYSKIRPNLSKVVVVDFDGLCSADMYPIEAIGDAKCLWYFMLSEIFLEQASSAGSRSVLPKINQKELSALTVTIPDSIEEQKEIANIIDSLFVKEYQVKESAEVVIEQIDTMKKAILARAFRGELGTNDPTEASAIELIKPIIEEKIKIEESKPKRTLAKRKEVSFVAKTILEALKPSEKLTPEKLKVETALEIDDFYDQLKVLIDNGQIREIRIDGESYLEAVK